MRKATKPRVVMIGSVTGNDNTVGGGGVYPIADLGDLEGLKNGAHEVSPITRLCPSLMEMSAADRHVRRVSIQRSKSV